MLRRRFLVPFAALLAMAAAAPVFFGGGSQAQEADVVAIANPAPSASAELRVWQSVRDPLRLWVSSRPDAGDAWTTSELNLAMIEGGGWRIASRTVDALDGEIELRVWQHPGRLSLVYLGARPGAGGSWDEYGTQRVELDETSRSGRYRYGDATVALEWPDADAPEPGSDAVTLCPPEGLDTETLSARVWRSVATPRRYYVSSRPDTDARWTLQRLTLAETGEDGWSAASLTVDAGDADFELQLWARGNAVALSARVAGTPWDEYGARSVTLNRTSRSGNYTYANRTVRLTLPEAEPPRPGASARTWDCPDTTPGGGAPGTGDGEAEATPTPTPDPENRAPWADAGDDQTVSVGDTVQLDGSDSADIDEDDLTYTWTQDTTTTDPDYYTTAITLTDPATATPSFEVPAEASGKKIAFTLTVTDEGGLTKTDAVTITVLQQQQGGGGGAPPGGGGPPPTSPGTQGPTLNVSAITATTARLAIAGHNGNWYYKHTNTGATCDGPASGTTANLTGLSVGTPYTYSAYSDNGCSTVIATAAEFTTKAQLTASSVTATGATLTIAGHTGNWYYKHTNTGATCDGPVSGTTKNLTGLTPGTSYTYSAYSASGCAGANQLATAPQFKTDDPSLTVSSVTATTATLTLTNWTIAKDGSWYYKPNGGTCSTAQSALRATVGSLSPGMTYTFTAYSDSTCSTALDAADEFTTLAQLTATGVTATTATLTIAGHTGNWYYKHTNTGATCDGPVSGTTKDLTGLTPGTSYTYSAYSDSECRTSVATASSFTTLAQLTADNVTATTVKLTLAGHSGQWWYKHDGSDPTPRCTSVSAGTSEVTVTGLSFGTTGTTYVFTAYKASTCASASALDAAPSFTTLVPSLASSSVTKNSATLKLSNWATADGKWYYKSTTTGQTTCTEVAAGTFSVSLTGLTAGTAYTFAAYSDSGCSKFVASAPQFTTLAGLTASGETATTVTLTIAGHTDAWYYKSTTTGQTACTGPVSSGVASVTRSGLTPGTSYTFSAYSDSGCANLLATAASFTTTHAPTVTFPNANVTAGNTATLSVTAGHTGSGTISSYTWSVTGKSAGAPAASLTSTTTTTATTGLVVPSGAWKASPHHTYTVKVRATDSAGEWTEASATLTVNNRAPNAVARADKAYALQTQRVDLGGQSSTDPDNDSHLNWIYSWAKTGGSYTKAITINNATYGSAWFTVPSDASTGDTIVITLTLGDGKGGTDTDNVTITVGSAPQQPNNPPVANPGASNQSFEMTPVNKNNPTVSLDGSGSSDPDGDTLYYNWSKYGGTCTENITLTNPNSAKPTFQWPSGCAVDTSVGLRLTVYDRVGVGGLSDTEDIRVWRQNGAPTATVNNGAAVTAWKHTDTSQTSSATVTAVISDDPDGDTLTYQWLVQKDGWSGTKPCPPPDQSKQCVDTTAPPPGISVSGTTTKTLTMTLANAAATGSDYTVNLIVKDSHGAVLTPSVGLTIANNTAPGTPTLSHSSLSGRHNQTYGLRASATDSDSGQTLSYLWTVQANCTSYLTLSSTNTATTNLTVGANAPQNATCTVKAKVTDGYGGESEATLIVNVSP